MGVLIYLSVWLVFWFGLVYIAKQLKAIDDTLASFFVKIQKEYDDGNIHILIMKCIVNTIKAGRKVLLKRDYGVTEINFSSIVILTGIWPLLLMLLPVILISILVVSMTQLLVEA